MANGGAQAIRLLSKQECDLVLLDYEMPVASSPQVMETIRAIPKATWIPIIFLTGKDDVESVRKVLSLSAQGYLLKTVNEATLLKKVEDVLATAE